MSTATCPYCKEEIQEGAVKCKHCGEILDEKIRAERVLQAAQHARPLRSRAIYVLVALFLGGLAGIHNFYARRYLQGIIQLVILLVLGWFWVGIVINAVWSVVDMRRVTADGYGRPMEDQEKGARYARNVSIFYAFFIGLFVLFLLWAILHTTRIANA